MLDIDKIKIEGNSIFIKSLPAVGVITLTGFLEITNETVTDFFTQKSFRYSSNAGVDFSDWIELTTTNITSLLFNAKDIIIFEITYLKNNPESVAEVQNLEFLGNQNNTGFASEYFNRSIFSYFFTNIDVEVLQWVVNVLGKMYKEGLLAKFISRVDENGSNEDFISLWRTIVHFYAYYVIYARRFEKFYENKYLLSEFLKQRGIVVDKNNTLADYQVLMSRYSHQIFNRGTIHIIDKQENSADVDGEFLRLIQYKDGDEFLFNLHRTHTFGWNLGNSSPLYRGLYQNESLQKFLPNQYQAVDYRNDYEISFFIRSVKKITITIEAKDIDGNTISLRSHKDNTNTSIALNDQKLYRSDKDIFIRVILYNSAKPIFSQDRLNINIGNNLVLNPLTALIKLKVLDEDGIDITPTTTKIHPMMTPYSHGMLQVYNWISCWIKQNNFELTLDETKAFIRKYLIPYNSHIELIDLVSKKPYTAIDEITTTTTRRLGWRGINPSCQYVIETRPTRWIGGDYVCELDSVRLGWRGQESSVECIQETTTTTTQAPPPILEIITSQVYPDSLGGFREINLNINFPSNTASLKWRAVYNLVAVPYTDARVSFVTVQDIGFVGLLWFDFYEVNGQSVGLHTTVWSNLIPSTQSYSAPLNCQLRARAGHDITLYIESFDSNNQLITSDQITCQI